MDDKQLEKVMKQVASDISDIVDKYFIGTAKFTFVIRADKIADPIVLTCDNDLGKVIAAIKESQRRQVSL